MLRDTEGVGMHCGVYWLELSRETHHSHVAKWLRCFSCNVEAHRRPRLKEDKRQLPASPEWVFKR